VKSKFLVISGMARSGTTFVDRAIASLPNVESLGEAFHAAPGLRTSWNQRVQPWKNDANPVDWLASIRTESNILSVKLLAGQLTDHAVHDILGMGQLILCRRHPLACIVSARQAKNCGAWNRMNDGKGMFGGIDPPYSNTPIRLEYDELAQYVDYHQRFEERLAALPNVRIVHYNEIASDPREVCQRIGLWLNAEPPQPMTQRMNPMAMHCRVVNWDQVRSWFPLNEYRFLEEEGWLEKEQDSQRPFRNGVMPGDG
jgi:Sulfotransferase domain